MSYVIGILLGYVGGAFLSCWLLDKGYLDPLFDWLDRRFT